MARPGSSKRGITYFRAGALGLFVFFLVGCRQKPTHDEAGGSELSAGDPRVREMWTRLEAIPAPLRNDRDPECLFRFYQKAEAVLDKENDPSLLAALCRTLHGRYRAACSAQKDVEAAKHRDVDGIYTEIQAAILNRLANMKTDLSAETLVDLLYDDRLVWDAGTALDIGQAITKCGKRARPFLAQRVRSEVEETLGYRLLKCIDRGEVYGP